VSALVRAELLKIRTTRSWWAYLIAILLITGLATAGEVGSSSDEERSAAGFLAGLVDVVSATTLVAVILGITLVTSEFRHGTTTPTFLATPHRELVLTAKTIAATVVAIGFALLSLLVVAAVALPWLAAVDAAPDLGDTDLATRAADQLLVLVLSALIGVAIGAVVHNQVAALVGTLVWVFVVENLLWGLFALLDVEGAVQYLPFRALDAADSVDGSGGEQMLSQGAAIVVSIAWIAALGIAGAARTLRRDIT
jgi:ABC-type transport system involved in multi-copper enzyme maturation permease subunit